MTQKLFSDLYSLRAGRYCLANIQNVKQSSILLEPDLQLFHRFWFKEVLQTNNNNSGFMLQANDNQPKTISII